MKKQQTRLLSAALCLVLLLTGCGRTEPPEPEPRPWDDSRIGLQIDETGFFDGESGRQPYSYAVPELLDDRPQAKAINAELLEYYQPRVEGAMADMEEGYDPLDSRVGWRAYWNGSLLSLLVETEFLYRQMDYRAWNYDFETGERLDNAALLARLGIGEKDAAEDLARAASRQFWKNMDGYGAEYAGAVMELEAMTLSRKNLEEAQLFLDGEGRLQAVTGISTPAGGGFYQAVLEPETKTERVFDRERDYLLAHLEDNRLTLTFRDTDAGREVLGEHIRRDTPYPVEGLYGNYVDLQLLPMGSSETLFAVLLDDLGGVSVVDVLACAQAGDRFVGRGPLPGLGETVSLRPEEYEGLGHTVFAADGAGTETDLSSLIFVTQDWEEDMPFFTYSWSSRDGQFALDTGRDGMTPLVAYRAQGDGYGDPICTGWASYMGTTPEGMVYTYQFYGQEGLGPSDSPTGETGFSGLAALQYSNAGPEEDFVLLMDVTPLTSPLFGLAVGETAQLVQTFG